jgi:hypothetical protein
MLEWKPRLALVLVALAGLAAFLAAAHPGGGGFGW